SGFPWLTEEPPAHPRKIAVLRRELAREQSHTLGEAGLRQSAAVEEAPRARAEQVQHNRLGLVVVAGHYDVHRPAVEIGILEGFPERPFEGADDPGAGPKLLQLFGGARVPRKQ